MPYAPNDWKQTEDEVRRLRRENVRLWAAFKALHAAARTDEHGEWHSVRALLDAYGVYHDNLSSLERLIEELYAALARTKT